ncbi:hypothetical protein DLJ46_31470 [Micromonospora globispora]|uniref:HTH luxR-type domain-containing protein n=2 Tax=Micromonospora globispora TaxID=1450148 RepID=A0A317JU67_9ACTN|nr:hypothetical protein DLJ46_31470 [Micromonospora globispora]
MTTQGPSIRAMSEGWPFVGRQEELDLIARAMGDPAVGGIVLAGPSGVGKTRLALEALAGVDPKRNLVRRVVATQATQRIPFGALAPVLPAQLPAVTDRINLLRLAAEALLGDAVGRRLVLAVDDAQLLDDLSAALIHQLVRGGASFVMVLVRADQPAPDPVTALWRHRLVERLDLQRLLRPDVEQALVEHLQGPLDGMSLERIWRASAGNALMLRELVSAGLEAAALQRVEGVWRWQGQWVFPPRLMELIEHRIGQLSDNEREVLELLAYAGPIGPDLLGRLVSPETVEAVEAKGLCWVEQLGRRMVLHLAHPLYAEALRRRTPVLRARRHQRRLADIVEETGARRVADALQLATWRIAAGAPSPPSILLAGAEQAWALLDLPLAERLARAAFAAGARVDATSILWRVLGLQNRQDELDALLAEVQYAAIDDRERMQLAVARAYTLCWVLDRVDEALAYIEGTLHQVAHPDAQAALQALRAVMLAHNGRMSEAAASADDLLAVPLAPGLSLASAHLAKAFALTWRGQTGQAVASLDLALAAAGWADHAPWLGVAARGWYSHTLLLHGDLAAATTAAEDAYELAVVSGWELAMGAACIARGQVARASGQLVQSLRWLREGLGLARHNHTSGPAYLLQAQLLGELVRTAAMLGDLDSAQRAIVVADASRRASQLLYFPRVELARPWITAARQGRAAGSRHAVAIAADLRQTQAYMYEARALHDAARLGGASRVAGRLRELAEELPSNLVQAYAAHATALTNHDAARLEAVSAQLDNMGFLLLAAEAAADAARAYRHAGRADSARRTAAHAAALTSRCEGAATPALQDLQAPQLTPRQFEISKLAAAGLSNEEIADRLTLSVRTVHNHLHQVYAKLGVTGRNQLAGVLNLPTQRPGTGARQPEGGRA